MKSNKKEFGMTSTSAAVAVFKHHAQAEDAIRKLAGAGFDISRINIVGRGCHTEEKVAGFYNAGSRIKFWGKYGALWGALWGLFAGGLFLTIPAIGPVMVLGHFGAMVLGAVEGAALGGGLSALGAAFFSIGIPKNSVIDYEKAVKNDEFLVMVHGLPEVVDRAREILAAANAAQLDIHKKVTAPGDHAAHHAA